jgi:hypothetical protein
VLAADGFDDTVLERVGAELGQGPAAIRKANRRGQLVGELAQGGLLRRGDPCRCPAALAAAHPVDSVVVEGMQVGLDRVGMECEEASDRGSIPAVGIQQQRFGTAQLPGVGRGLQKVTQESEFSGGGAARRQRAGHGRTSEGEGQPSIVPRVM